MDDVLQGREDEGRWTREDGWLDKNMDDWMNRMIRSANGMSSLTGMDEFLWNWDDWMDD
jgi:hypothetical protein